MATAHWLLCLAVWAFMTDDSLFIVMGTAFWLVAVFGGISLLLTKLLYNGADILKKKEKWRDLQDGWGALTGKFCTKIEFVEKE